MSAAWTLPEVEPTTWAPELLAHLSASQLAMLERCPEQYRRRYILGEKEPPSAALVWGTVDGRAHGVNFTQKITSYEDLPRKEVQEAFATLLDEDVEARGGEGEIDWGDTTPAKVKDAGALLVGTYHQAVSPRVQPTAVEEHFSLDIPGVPVPFVGYIDVSTEAVSIERKTTAGKSAAIPPHYRLQTLGYLLARRRPVELHISTRTKIPAVYTPEEEPGLLLDEWRFDAVERLIAGRARLLLAYYDTFGLDQPWPDAIGTMAWHMPVCDMCGYRPNCHWWS